MVSDILFNKKSSMITDTESLDKDFMQARKEIGDEEFSKRYRKVFDKDCLDYVETIVINLPNTCYAHCPYCIDKQIKDKTMDEEDFLETCKKTFDQFKTIPNISITGGTMSSKNFNKLLKMIREYYPDTFINWNTNGILVDHSYDEAINLIDVVNLHRNHYMDYINQKYFFTKQHVLSLDEAKELFKDKLYLRITVDQDTKIERYLDLNVPLYLNRLLPGNEDSDTAFFHIVSRFNIHESNMKRRNVYVSASYKNIPIRLCVGDRLSTYIKGRKPVFLNVIIIHRNGVVSGSWHEDDKFLFKS